MAHNIPSQFTLTLLCYTSWYCSATSSLQSTKPSNTNTIFHEDTKPKPTTPCRDFYIDWRTNYFMALISDGSYLICGSYVPTDFRSGPRIRVWVSNSLRRGQFMYLL